MIQRIQSVFLLIITVLQLSLLFLPALSFNGTLNTVVLTGLSVKAGGQMLEFPVIYLVAIADLVLMSIMTVFQYNNRKRQMLFSKVLMGVSVAEMAVLAFYFIRMSRLENVSFNAANSLGLLFPPVCLVLAWMAYNRIKKDDDLVRSVDRIR